MTQPNPIKQSNIPGVAIGDYENDAPGPSFPPAGDAQQSDGHGGTSWQPTALSPSVVTDSPAITAPDGHRLGAENGAAFLYANSYGVKADGIIGTTGSPTGGSTTFTDANANFQTSDVGKTIIIEWSGASLAGENAGFVTTIAARVSATQITLQTAPPAGSPTNNYNYCYGTDDTANFQTFLNAVAAAAIAYGKATGIIEDRVHVIAGALVQDTIEWNGTSNVHNVSGLLYNSQLQLPAIPTGVGGAGGSGGTIGIEIRSRTFDQELSQPAGTVQTVEGAALFTSLGARSEAAFNSSVGVASIIGGPASGTSTQGQVNGPWTNVNAVFRGIASKWTHQPYGFGLDLGNCLEAEVTHCRYVPNEAYNQYSVPARHGGGYILPATNNDDNVKHDRNECLGMNYGFVVGDHATGGQVDCYKCNVAMVPFNAAGGTTLNTLQRFDDQGNLYGIAGHAANWVGAGALSGAFKCIISGWHNEMGSGAFARQYDVYDPNGWMQLEARFWMGGLSTRNTGTLVVQGAYNSKFIDIGLGPGRLNAVQVPSSGVAGPVNGKCDNTLGPGYWSGSPQAFGQIWRDVVLIISGGTVSAIEIDGFVTGLTSGVIVVPSGKNYKITYTVAPTINGTCL